jgi:hypothetical protein
MNQELFDDLFKALLRLDRSKNWIYPIDHNDIERTMQWLIETYKSPDPKPLSTEDRQVFVDAITAYDAGRIASLRDAIIKKNYGTNSADFLDAYLEKKAEHDKKLEAAFVWIKQAYSIEPGRE